MEDQTGATYAASGVDIEAGDRAVELMKFKVSAATRPEVVGGLGGFAGLFALDLAKYRRPLLASSTDGVGTKIAIARAVGKHDTIGLDLVGMVVDDIVVCGAEPLFMQDYIACGKVVPEQIAEIVGGIAEGCKIAGTALVGGETAEHPGLMEPDEYDIAGTAVGAVEADRTIGPDRVRVGDALVAMGSSGLHSNGYSLVRHVLAGAGLDLHSTPADLGRTLAEELLEPTRIYALDCLALIEALGVEQLHALCHVTGGGIPGNLPRVLPTGTTGTVDRSTWTPQPVFDLVRRAGSIASGELEKALNVGVGMIAVVAESRADRAVEVLTARGVPAWRCGAVTSGAGAEAPAATTMVGRHP